MTIKLLVGLQNPGQKYDNTRHNVGAWFLHAFANQEKLSFHQDKKCQADYARFNLDGLVCHLILPLTFMNQSGNSVRLTSQFYQILPEEMLVIHDDLDLIPGRIQLKTGGGHGGHNGLRHIIEQLGTRDFNRLRIGIGHPGNRDDVVDYVLGKPMSTDKQAILEAIHRGLTMIDSILLGDLDAAKKLINN